MKKRDEALKEFDEVTAPQIRAEIEKEHQGAIDQLESEFQTSKAAFEEAETKATQAAENITKSYEVYLGKKNTSAEKIDSLISLIQEGKATTIVEALDILNGEIK